MPPSHNKCPQPQHFPPKNEKLAPGPCVGLLKKVVVDNVILLGKVGEAE